jgi:hypothetical protein
MSVCVYSVFVLSCMKVAALRQADPPFKESYRQCKRSRNCKAAKVQELQLELKPIITAHNECLSKTRSIPYWTTGLFSYA